MPSRGSPTSSPSFEGKLWGTASLLRMEVLQCHHGAPCNFPFVWIPPPPAQIKKVTKALYNKYVCNIFICLCGWVFLTLYKKVTSVLSLAALLTNLKYIYIYHLESTGSMASNRHSHDRLGLKIHGPLLIHLLGGEV